MKLIINNKETETEALTMGELATSLSLPDRGVAIALADKVIARKDWEFTPLHENDDILIIKAACGG
jgi:sulfur carrier protein